MANINGVDKNAALIKQVQDKVDTILRTSEKMEEDLVTIHQGKKVLTDELEKYKKLEEVIEILGFSDKDESSLYAFENIYLEKSKQERLFELANDSELDLNFPSAFGEYGEIPNHPGIKCPRPKSLLETTETYEEYLKEYYSRHKIEPQFNEDGLRSEYPHERFEWSKGTASQPASPDYVHPNYKAYKEWKAEEAKKTATTGDDDTEKGKGGNSGTGTGTGTGNSGNNTGDGEKGKGKASEDGNGTDSTKTDGNGPDLDGDATDRKKKSAERTEQRKGLFGGLFKKNPNRRVYVKDKKTLKDYLLAPFRKISEADGTLANGQNWPKIKRLLVGAAIVVGGAALIATVGGPLISTVATGLLNWPMMLTGALTGTMTTSGGAMVTLTVLDRIVMGLVGAAVPAGIIGSIYHIIKKRKGKAIDDVDDKGPKGPQDGDDDKGKDKGKGKGKGDDKGHDKGKGKGKGDGDGDGTGDDDKGKGGDTTGGNGDDNDEPVVVEGTSFKERVEFIATKLHEINNELAEIEMQKEAFKGQTSETAVQQLELLETSRKKLELMKSKYQIELMKLTGNTYAQDATMGEEDLSAGGMKK